MIEKFGQLITKDDQRTLTLLLGAYKDMMQRDQLAGNNITDAMFLDWIGSSHQSEDTRNGIYLTFIIMITFSMFCSN